MSPRKILVTAALPYANGPIHIGHLVEYIQTDIWVRFQKLRGNNCRFFCADDTHGTAIMLSAQKNKISEEEWIARISEEHQRDFASFDIQFDHYGSTNSESNRQLCHEIWQNLKDAGLIFEKEIDQLFDPEIGIFLADRYVTGTCPNCGATEQYGDNCEKCGETYSPADLIDPKSSLSGATPEVRAANHVFVRLEDLREFLLDWTQNGDHLQTEVANFLLGSFLNKKDESGNIEPLKDWDVSRPSPYFGFEIPGTEDNFWYVWFDAPIGYIASTKDWCEKTGEDFDSWWKNKDTEVHHFIGKDIKYFHTLFWPGVLSKTEFNLPEKVHVHGFLLVNGKKMAKRDGTFIKAEVCAKHLPANFVRYYYASKLGPKEDDIDLNFEEFITKTNSDLVGKVVNLASRSAKFVQKIGLSAEYPDDGGLFKAAADAGDEIAKAYENCDYNKAVRLILELADRANPFVENAEPWNLKKDPDKQQELQDVCSVALNLFRQIMIYLSPVIPELATKTGELLNCPIESWEQAKTPLVGTDVNKFKHMLKRIEQKDIDAMIDETQAEAAEENAGNEINELLAKYGDGPDSLEAEPLADECTIDDFMKVDLRVARVIKAEHVEEAKKLLKLTLSLGGDSTRQVFAGIKAAYNPEDLEGRLVVMVANLAPRKMRFGLSEGMVCASGPGGEEVFLLDPDKGAKPGQRVH